MLASPITGNPALIHGCLISFMRQQLTNSLSSQLAIFLPVFNGQHIRSPNLLCFVPYCKCLIHLNMSPEIKLIFEFSLQSKNMRAAGGGGGIDQMMTLNRQETLIHTRIFFLRLEFNCDVKKLCRLNYICIMSTIFAIFSPNYAVESTRLVVLG